MNQIKTSSTVTGDYDICMQRIVESYGVSEERMQVLNFINCTTPIIFELAAAALPPPPPLPLCGSRSGRCQDAWYGCLLAY